MALGGLDTDRNNYPDNRDYEEAENPTVKYKAEVVVFYFFGHLLIYYRVTKNTTAAMSTPTKTIDLLPGPLDSALSMC